MDIWCNSILSPYNNSNSLQNFNKYSWEITKSFLDINFLHRYVDAITNLQKYSISFDGIIPSTEYTENNNQFLYSSELKPSKPLAILRGILPTYLELQNYPFSLKTFNKCLADPRNKL